METLIYLLTPKCIHTRRIYLIGIMIYCWIRLRLFILFFHKIVLFYSFCGTSSATNCFLQHLPYVIQMSITPIQSLCSVVYGQTIGKDHLVVMDTGLLCTIHTHTSNMGIKTPVGPVDVSLMNTENLHSMLWNWQFIHVSKKETRNTDNKNKIAIFMNRFYIVFKMKQYNTRNETRTRQIIILL